MTHTAYNHATYVFDVRCRPGDSGEPEIRHVILADHAGNQALRQLFESLASDSCRYPVTTALELQGSTICTLLDHGIPAKELHAAIDQAETYRRHDAEFLPPVLDQIHRHLVAAAGVPADRYVQPLADGEPWGYVGPLVLIGRLPHSSAHFVSLDPADPGVVVVRRDPAWAGGRPHIAFSAADPNLAGRVSRLIEESSKDHPDRRGDDLEKWSEEARRRAGVAPWGEAGDEQIACFGPAKQASPVDQYSSHGTPGSHPDESGPGRTAPITISGPDGSGQEMWTVPADWEASRARWAAEVSSRERCFVIPPWEEEEQAEEPAARAQAAKDLTPELLAVYNFTADGPVELPCDCWTYPDGSEWGVKGPLIRNVSGARKAEFYLSISPDDPRNLRVSRAPAWLLHSYVDIPFDDADLPWAVLSLKDDRDPDTLRRLDHTGDDDDDV